MGDGARRDRDIGEDEEIGEPQAAADRGGVVFDRFFDFFQIVGLGGDGGRAEPFSSSIRVMPASEGFSPRSEVMSSQPLSPADLSLEHFPMRWDRPTPRR